MYSKIMTKKSMQNYSADNTMQIESSSGNIRRIKEAIEKSDAVIIGAGSGLSTAAGYTYSGDRFWKYFYDFADKYDIRDMYSGGFYPFSSPEIRWAWWSRHIWLNRYAPIPNNTYDKLFSLISDKDYFVITTNVDHCFQRSGFDKKRLFYTQGDYGLFQCSTPCSHKTYDNEDLVRKMLLSQGFQISLDNELIISDENEIRMSVPEELVPMCPDCNAEMSMNLRADDTFVEDDGWHAASERYSDFIGQNKDTKVLYLELGVGMNTPIIIKYPFWNYTMDNENAVYACINMGSAYAPDEISDRSILIDSDIYNVIQHIK